MTSPGMQLVELARLMANSKAGISAPEPIPPRHIYMRRGDLATMLRPSSLLGDYMGLSCFDHNKQRLAALRRGI